jgi:UrcA family protein
MNSNVRIQKNSPCALSIAMLLTCVWVFSNASADEQVRSERVKFHDLNVQTPEGVQALYGRIHLAARRVCSESDPILREASTACARKAEANAIEKLSLPQLTAYYKMKRGDNSQSLIAAR